MKTRRKYRLSLEDESRLEKIGEWSFTPRAILPAAAGLFVAAVVIGFLVVLLTPAKQLIPGYYRPSERAATEEAMLRLDSIREVYERNNAYLTNLMTILNSDRTAAVDTPAAAAPVTPLTPDSLLPASREESRFVRMMQEREKFNISVLAPMAAEGMLFYPVCDQGIVTADSRSAFRSLIAAPADAALMALADGSVVAVYGTPSGKGYSVILQHPNGFVSRYSGLASPMAGQGDVVAGGQIIGLAPPPKAGKPALVGIEIWHNGNPLVPYQYITQ